jgi:hypothetical protein
LRLLRIQGLAENIGLQRVDASNLTLPTRFSVDAVTLTVLSLPPHGIGPWQRRVFPVKIGRTRIRFWHVLTTKMPPVVWNHFSEIRIVQFSFVARRFTSVDA